MNKQKWDNLVNDCIKPMICICGNRYNNDYKGGFISNGLTHIWYCSPKCGQKTLSKLY